MNVTTALVPEIWQYVCIKYQKMDKNVHSYFSRGSCVANNIRRI